jgi:hypothetical protein
LAAVRAVSLLTGSRNEEVDGKMNTQTLSKERQIRAEDLMPFPLEELKDLLNNMYNGIDQVIHEIIIYTQEATQIEVEKTIKLEKDFKRIWEQMQVAVEAVIARAVASEKNALEWSKLAQMLREGMALLQAVPMDADLTWEWVAKRNALVARTTALLKRSPWQEFIHQLVSDNPDALLQLLQEVTSRLARQGSQG